MMQITVNGERRDINDSVTVGEMLARLNLGDQKIAVELNREIVRKKDWETVFLKDADKIEIVYFVGGG